MTEHVSELPEPLPQIVGAMEDKKALDVVVLDLRASGAFTDYFVVGSGQTTRQVQAIVDSIGKRLRSIGMRPTHIEGYALAQWVLIDCFDVIIHVFTRDTRELYDLERLWGSATRIELPSAGATQGD
jgi:ribosome-associated protein